ncbi:MAG: glycosyltransferase family 39 protein [Terriglobales bacterium]
MSLVARMQPVRADSAPGSASSSFFTVRLLHAIADFADTRGWLLFTAISLACGWGLLNTMVTRRLDHDEIFTFYIAQAPSLHRLLQVSHAVDFQPPLSYLLVRASFAMFGTNAWSCRLPFLLASFGTAALMFYFVGRHCSPHYGLIAVLLLWGSPYSFLAYEARPYALLLCFSTLILVSWYQAATERGLTGRRWALAMVTVSGFGLLLSHVFGVLVYAAFFAAELLRSWIRRKPDWRVWLALLVPTISILTYLPMLHNHSITLFAREYRVTPLVLLSFYWESIRFVITPLALIAALALLWPIFHPTVHKPIVHNKPPETAAANSHAIRVPFGFLLVSISLIPLAIGTLLARTGTAFFSRYGVVWLVPFAMVPALVLGYRTQHDRLVGTAAVLLLAVFFFFNTTGKSWLLDQVSNLAPPRVAARLLYVLSLPPIVTVHYPPIPSYLQAGIAAAPLVSHLDSVAPGLPLVANTGLTFVEADHQESAQVAQRLYLLTDEKAASTIARDTVFNHYERLKDAFPAIRGKVEPYCAFISSHPRFVVVGAYNHPQGWLLRKLDRDGAELRVIGTCSGYTEECQIYEVSVRPEECRNPGVSASAPSNE